MRDKQSIDVSSLWRKTFLLPALFAVSLWAAPAARSSDWQVLLNQGRQEVEGERFVAAEKTLTRALDLAQKENNDLHVAQTLTSIGNLNVANYKFDKALPNYERALPIFKRLYGPALDKDPFYVDCIERLGNLYADFDRPDEAIPYLEKVVAFDEKQHRRKLDDEIGTLKSLAETYRKDRRYKDTVASFNKAMVLDARKAGANSLLVSADLNYLGNVYKQKIEQFEPAEKYYLKSLSIRLAAAKTPAREYYTRLAECYDNLQLLYRSFLKWDKAEVALKNDIACIEKAEGPNDDSLLKPLRHLAEVLHKEKKIGEAKKALQRRKYIESQSGQ